MLLNHAEPSGTEATWKGHLFFKKFIIFLDIMYCKAITYLPNILILRQSLYLFKHVIILVIDDSSLGYVCLIYFWCNEIFSLLHYCSLFLSCFCSLWQLTAFNLCLLFIFSSLGYKLHENKILIFFPVSYYQ